MPSVRFEDLPPELQAQVADRLGEPLLPPVTKESLTWQRPPKRKPRASKARKTPERKRHVEGPVAHRGRPEPQFEFHGGHILVIVLVGLFLASAIWW
jgi:hypothetical protein